MSKDLKINILKTKVGVFQRETGMNKFCRGGETLEHVEGLVYSGSNFLS